MASEKQIEANRRNAQKSTGPTTDEGKQQSRRNALKHGMAGAGIVLPEEAAEAIARRKEQWRDEYRPVGPSQEWVYDRMVTETVLADECTGRRISLAAEQAERAAESWDDDRDREVEQLAASLPRRPAIIRYRLLASKQGVEWMVTAWGDLDRRVGLEGAIGDEELTRALDLLGIDPASRSGARAEILGTTDELTEWRSLVDFVVADLRRRLDDYLIDRDERARAYAEIGHGPDGPELRLVRRYEAAALRRYDACKADLLRQSKGRPSRFAPDPAPRDRPSPPPSTAPAAPRDQPARTAPDRVPSPAAARPSPAVEPRPSSPVPDLAVEAVPRSQRPMNRQRRRAEARALGRNR